jgi:hypothetical protein
MGVGKLDAPSDISSPIQGMEQYMVHALAKKIPPKRTWAGISMEVMIIAAH